MFYRRAPRSSRPLPPDSRGKGAVEMIVVDVGTIDGNRIIVFADLGAVAASGQRQIDNRVFDRRTYRIKRTIEKRGRAKERIAKHVRNTGQAGRFVKRRIIEP